MPKTILEQILCSEENLRQAENQLHQTKAIEKALQEKRSVGKLLYQGWVGTKNWNQWRTLQLEAQGWQCAICGQRMRLGPKIKLASGKLKLRPDHPTVEHILPKCYFPALTLAKQNLVMACWDCNRNKGTDMVEASRLRHQQLMQKLKHLLQQP